MTQPVKIISLKNQKEFDAVNKSGRKIYGKHFIMIHSSKYDLEKQDIDKKSIYLGLKVSRKVGNAAQRNKIKRRFREIVRVIAKDNPQYMNHSFILIPKKTINSITYQELLGDITSKIKI